jgi:hypothetical protein
MLIETLPAAAPGAIDTEVGVIIPPVPESATVTPAPLAGPLIPTVQLDVPPALSVLGTQEIDESVVEETDAPAPTVILPPVAVIGIVVADVETAI